MPSTYLVEFDGELDPETRRIFKDRLGDLVRQHAHHNTAVSIDHLGTPITDLNQEPDHA